MDRFSPYLLILGVLVVWSGLWITGSHAFSRLSGWAELAKHYRQVDAFTGHRFLFQSALIRNRLFGFRGTLIVGANARGLLLRVLAPFSFGHPSLFVPWEEITCPPAKGGSLRTYIRLEFERSRSVPLIISRQLALKLAESSQGALSVPGAI